jgi:hypothetical protein
MENEKPTHQVREGNAPSCNVSQKFNFSVGVTALVVAGIIAYLIYKYFIQG